MGDTYEEIPGVELKKYFDLSQMETKDIGFLVHVAENSERYLDMCKFIRQLVTTKLDGCKDGDEVLTAEERNLFSVAYKNVVGSKRQALRQLHDGEEKEQDEALSKEDQAMYINTIREELFMWCKEILMFLTQLVKKSETRVAQLRKDKDSSEDAKGSFNVAVEAQVFYKKMIGDYYRYLAEEFKDVDALAKECENAYQAALKIANDDLLATNATRLGLALNFSVAYYEIMKKQKEACKLAKEAFDAAIEKLDSLNDNSYKDSTLIMQLLRDNLTIWRADDPEAPADGADLVEQ